MSAAGNTSAGSTTVTGNMTSPAASPETIITKTVAPTNPTTATTAQGGMCPVGPINMTRVPCDQVQKQREINAGIITIHPTTNAPSSNATSSSAPTNATTTTPSSSENNATRTQSDLAIAQQGGTDSGCALIDKRCLEIWSGAYLLHHPNLPPNTKAFWACSSRDYSNKCFDLVTSKVGNKERTGTEGGGIGTQRGVLGAHRCYGYSSCYSLGYNRGYNYGLHGGKEDCYGVDYSSQPYCSAYNKGWLDADNGLPPGGHCVLDIDLACANALFLEVLSKTIYL